MGDLTPDPKAQELLDKLHDYHKSIEEEFKVDDPENPEEVRGAVRRTLLKEMQDLTDHLLTLATGAASETVQLSALKYVVDLAIGKGAAGDGDSLENLLRDLNKTPK